MIILNVPLVGKGASCKSIVFFLSDLGRFFFLEKMECCVSPDSELIPFVSFSTLDDTPISMETIVEPIQKFSVELASSIFIKPTPAQTEDNKVTKMSVKGKFVLKKIQKLLKKRKDARYLIIKKKIDIMTEAINWILVCYSNKVVVSFKIDEYRLFVSKLLSEDKNLCSIERKITSLKSYMHRYDLSEQKGKLANCIVAMRDCEQLSDVKLDYCPICTFDSAFSAFINYNGMRKRFDSFAEQILKKDKVEITTQDLSQLATTFSVLLNPESKGQQTVVRSSVRRVCYEYVFFHYEQILTSKNSVQFMKKCAEFSKRTPKSLDIDKLFPDEYKNMEFSSIVDGSKDLADIANTVMNIQYMVSPYDISYVVYDSLNKLQHIDGITNLKQNEMMCFDDLISFFAPVFAYSPPVNAERISEYIANCRFPSTSSLDFGRMIFISAVSLIIDS